MARYIASVRPGMGMSPMADGSGMIRAVCGRIPAGGV